MIKTELIQSDSDYNKTLLSCKDSIDISLAQELIDALMNALDSGNGIVIDLSEITRIDTSCLQVLLSFTNHCKSSNIDFSWKQAPELLLNTAELLGLRNEFI